MYEMSLPYGLDLNNQLNLDKSATKVGVLVNNIKNSDLIALAERSHNWLKDNHRADAKPGSSVSIMFAHIGENNIRSMLFGGLLAILGVTITILIALRSVRYAIISIIPNSIPAFMAFGVWGLVNGQVNMAVAMVFSISLGILVDDTVHFITKYRRGRTVKGFTKEQSIEYAFSNVGMALVITTLVLATGFSLLGTSSFNLNAMAGNLTAITIVIALIFDFLILPPILMLLDKEDDIQVHTN
jgi:predicted RND superfamily exporter protein